MWSQRLSRRQWLVGATAQCVGLGLTGRPGAAPSPVKFGLTPVFLNSDQAVLAGLKGYLEGAIGRPVELVGRRTYQEITALLVSRQLDAAWICGYPFVAYRDEISLVAVPIWRGQTRYQSYLIASTSGPAQSLEDLRGSVHAFSDPDSNSGFLVTSAELLKLGTSAGRFFKHSFFTYGHRNVIRAVAAGLATSGSVDGYVYEVLRETEPELVRATRVVSRSEWLGFPPVACPAAAIGAEPTIALRKALLDMSADPRGRAVLGLLKLDGFRDEPPELYDGIATRMKQLRGASEG